MTLFRDSFSTHQLLPPWTSKGAKTWIYIIEIERDRIQDYLDWHFNVSAPDRAPYYYKAISGPTFGSLEISRHPEFSSEYDDARGFNWLSHTNVTWMFPVNRYRITPDNLLVDSQLVWVQPFALDDNSYFMFSSIEIMGTQIELATIRVVEGAADRLQHIDVAIEGLRKFSPRSRSHQIGCIHIEMAEAGKPDDLGTLLEKQPSLEEYTGVLANSIVTKGRSKTPGVTEINTLKQFRDAFDMRRAAARSVVASQITYSNVDNVHAYQGSKIAIDFMWSDSTKEALKYLFGLEEPKGEGAPRGHPAGGPAIDENGIDWDMFRVRVPVKLALSYSSDMRYNVTKVLHVYGG